MDIVIDDLQDVFVVSVVVSVVSIDVIVVYVLGLPNVAETLLQDMVVDVMDVNTVLPIVDIQVVVELVERSARKNRV